MNTASDYALEKLLPFTWEGCILIAIFSIFADAFLDSDIQIFCTLSLQNTSYQNAVKVLIHFGCFMNST